MIMHAVEGVYGRAALSKDFELAEQVTAGVFASLGAGDDNYNKGYGLTTDDALIDGELRSMRFLCNKRYVLSWSHSGVDIRS